MSPSDGPTTAAGEARPEDVAELALTAWAQRFVTETTRWLEDSGKAFERHLHKALHPPGYTTAEVVRDVTDVWARNLGYLARLFTAPPATAASSPAAEAAVDDEVTVAPPPPPAGDPEG
jgi:hypothetical protein